MTLIAPELLSRTPTSAVYLLTIAGLPYRFHSDSITPAGAAPLTDAGGLITVGASSQKGDPIGGIAEEEPVTITLAVTATTRELLRIGPSGSALQARLRTTLPIVAAAPDPITTDRDLVAAGWPGAGTFWVGQEAIAYTGIGGGGNVNFTGITRGAWGSRVERHTYSATEGWEADITGHCTAWPSRRAWVAVSHRRVIDGSVDPTWVQIISGTIQAPPQKSADGLTIELTIVPLTQSIRGKVGGDALKTRLTQGYHLFEESAHTKIRIGLGFGEGDGYSGIVYAVSAAGGVVVWAQGSGPLGAAAGADAHAEVYDVALLGDPDTGLPHPRSGQIRLPAGNGTRNNPAHAGPPVNFVVAPLLGFGIGVDNSDPVVNTTSIEWHDYDILASLGGATSVLRWPRDFILDFNTWGNVVTNKGAAGRFARMSMHDIESDSNRPALNVRPNSTKHVGPLGVVLAVSRIQHLWYGIDWAPPDATGEGWAFWPLDRGRGRRALTGFHRGPDNDPAMAVRKRAGAAAADQGHGLIPLRRRALAWWSTGERYVLVEGNFGGRTPPFDVLVRCPEDGVFSGGWTWHRVIAVAARNDPVTGLPIGYSLELDLIGPANRFQGRAYGDWPGFERAELTLHVRFQFVDVATVLLRLLLSGEGNGWNHATYDVLPFGLNFSSAEVAIESFEGFALPSYAGEVDIDFRDDIDVRELVEGLLKAIGAQLATRVDLSSGVRRLALVRTGLPTELEDVASFVDGDAVDGVFSTHVDPTVINGADIGLNWDGDDERFDLELQLRDEPAYKELGRWEILSLKMRGIQADATDGIRAANRWGPWFREVLAQYGRPTRVATLPVSAARTLLLTVGDVVRLTSTRVDDETGQPLTASTAMRITARECDTERGVGSLTGRLHFARGTGWAPCAQVSAIPGVDTVDTAAHTFSGLIHPVTGEAMRDSDYLREVLLAAGGTLAVYHVPWGNYAARTLHNIVGIQTAGDPNPGRITFALAHGLAGVGGTLEPQGYDTQPAQMQAYAFQADSADSLGAAGDPAQEYV